MLDRAIDAARAAGLRADRGGDRAPSRRQVKAHVAARLGAGSTAVQDPPLGTGHAVLAAKAALAGFEGDVVVTYADCPLLDAPAIEPLFELRGGRRRSGGARLRRRRAGRLRPADHWAKATRC